MTDPLTTIWVPAGIIFAFQIQMVRWRIDREIAMEAESERVWLPLCDYLNLLSMATTAFVVFVLPIVFLKVNGGASSIAFAKYGVGLTAILLIGYLVALMAHYRLFVAGRGPRPPVTLQELVAVGITIFVALAYMFAVWGAVEPEIQAAIHRQGPL